jgi:hypothetical protein
VLGAAGYRTVQAAAVNQQTAAGSVLTQASLGRGVPGGVKGEYLAEALGITTDELEAAYQAANTAAIDAALQAGLITQAQADEMKARGNVGRWSGLLEKNGVDYQILLADALGITVEELQAAYTKAAELALTAAVADGRLTQEEADMMKARQALYGSDAFQTAMQSAFTAAVNQAVADGLITQAQADQILSESANMFVRGFGGFGGHGGRGHHGGERGGFGLPDAAPETQTAPTSGSGL